MAVSPTLLEQALQAIIDLNLNTGPSGVVNVTAPLVNSGTDTAANLSLSATTADIPDSTDARYVTDAELAKIAADWTDYFVTGSDFTTTSNSAVDITGLVTGTLTASTQYEIEILLKCLNDADTNGMKFDFHAGGTGTAAQVEWVGTVTSNSGTAATSFSRTAVDTASAAALTYSAGMGVYSARGFATTRSTGTPTFSMRVAKVTSGTATVKVGSKLRIKLAHT